MLYALSLLMPLDPTSFRLPRATKSRLDAVAHKTGQNKVSLMCAALHDFFDKNPTAEAAADAVGRYVTRRKLEEAKRR